MGQNVEMDLAALAGFQRDSDGRGKRFTQLSQQLEQARVGRESFGMIPGSGEIFSGYEERVDSCLDGLKDCAEAVEALGEMVVACGEEQQRNDDDAMRQFETIMGQLGKI